MSDAAQEILIAELDFGHNPPAMLVVRETMRTRVAGILICLVLATPFLVIVLAGVAGSGFWILVGCAALPLAIASFLVWQVLNRKTFYLALDDQWLRRRWGPRGLLRVPLAELGRFEARRGKLEVPHHDDSHTRRLVLIKDAYSPESLPVLAQRLNSWREHPTEHRSASMAQLDWADAEHQARNARKLIWGGLSSAILAVILIIVAWQMRHRGWRGIRILISGFVVLLAVGQIAAGVVLHIGAWRKGRRLKRNAVQIALEDDGATDAQ